jgi:hypothetical protein
MTPLGPPSDPGATYARYPHYPQGESAWRNSDSVTAFGCGQDELSATRGSLPSHSPRRIGPVSARRQGGSCNGKAADEAAARRKLRACPLADAKAAGFESAHRLRRPSGTRSRQAGSGFRFACRPAGSGTSVNALPPAKEGFRPRPSRAGPGFDPGAAKTVGPRVSAHDLPRRNRGFGRGSFHFRFRYFGGGSEMVGRGGAQVFSESVERRTVRAPALSGSQRVNRQRPRPWTEPGGSVVWVSARATPLETSQRSECRLRTISTRWDSGGWRRRQPPLLFWAPAHSRRAVAGLAGEQPPAFVSAA